MIPIIFAIAFSAGIEVANGYTPDVTENARAVKQ
jgi:hypothetical protein